MTSFENKCEILGDVWLTYRNDGEFKDFIEYNDLGLPLAYAISNGIVKQTEQAAKFIEEAFSLLLSGLGIDEDKGWEFLDEILAEAA
jgi:hypothetical protein